MNLTEIPLLAGAARALEIAGVLVIVGGVLVAFVLVTLVGVRVLPFLPPAEPATTTPAVTAATK